jgi:NADPH2:quinone reductase
VRPRRERFEPGDRVMAIVGGGGQAELASSTSASDAGARGARLAGRGRRARGLHDRPRRALHPGRPAPPGERLLVHGAAGGVGTAAVQLGVMAGARVTATVRNEPEAARAVAALGANAIEPEGFEEHGPFDVILELVGAPNLPGEPRRRSPPAAGSS